jgi:Domain of unknown function (DUF4286)
MTLIYNITIQVNWIIHEEWLPWMQEVHIPEVMSTGMFTHFRILRLLEIDETEGPTYAIQYFASHREKYDYYIENHAAALREKTFAKWSDQFHAFRTLMEVVN